MIPDKSFYVNPQKINDKNFSLDPIESNHLANVLRLNIGDKIELTMSDGLMTTYIISGTVVSDKPEVALSSVTLGSESLILTTCWPFNAMKSGDQRYLIFADKVNVSASLNDA